MTGRVLLIGLDSADAELIERWSDQGHLPTFARLRQEGLWTRLRTTAEVMHVSAWPTIYTGVTPGGHGMYHAYQVRAGDQRIQRTSPAWCARPPFWKHLDDAGRRCIVLDAFMDWPLPGFKGQQVLEYGTWTWFGEPGSTPPGLLKDILRQFGPYPVPDHSRLTSVPADLVGFRDRLVAGATKKAEVSRWLMREQPWDMLFVTFAEPHGAGHYLWHAEDPHYPSHPAGGVAGMATPIRDVYVAVDRAIGEILQAVDDRTTVLVTSGDGMGPNYSATHHLPPMLARMGLYASQESGGGGSKKSLLKQVRGMVPMPVRRAITRCLPRDIQHRLSTGWVNAGMDWGRTSIFPIPNSNEAYLRVNLRGREPQGIVAPGGESERLLETLGAEMRALVNPDNGVLAAERVTLVDDAFAGPERRHLPDLVVGWDNEARVLRDLSGPCCGQVHGPAGYEIAPYYTGNHRALAFLAARGPHVDSCGGAVDGHIVDIPASILALLRVDAPAWFEGEALPQLLPAARVAAAVG
ncbi:MAG TPA: alkaline phosphatase family protein [Geminicoccaceae bacterium]|nr:alkaline phosphatase family protein [Geminicoccus sp.]HMU49189.1 alkaline phosphatase family protein [Geminicoccaceae bacterium]